jgi:DNA-binding SARP family transcriptional activator
LLRAGARRGNLVLVRRVFDECTRVLRQDLGVAPSPATVQVFQQAISAQPTST